MLCLLHVSLKNKIIKHGSSHDLFVFIAYAQMPLIIAHADVSSYARGLKFGLSFHLHPYFVHTSSKDSSEYAHMRRLA